MTDLPDIDTSEVSFIAFYNTINDGGVDSIDPEDALTDDSLVTYTVYDNGWEGEYEISYSDLSERNANVRVKSDGWVVAYFDRTENYDLESSRPNLTGPWDIISGWTNDSNVSGSIVENNLERAINSLVDNLDNSGDISYVADDVGLYDYSTPNATGFAHFADRSDTTVGFLHTGIDIKRAVLTAAAVGNDFAGEYGRVFWDPDDTNVRIVNSGGGNKVSAFDLTEAERDVLSSDIEYDVEIYGHGDEGASSSSTLIWYEEV